MRFIKIALLCFVCAFAFACRPAAPDSTEGSSRATPSTGTAAEALTAPAAGVQVGIFPGGATPGEPFCGLSLGPSTGCTKDDQGCALIGYGGTDPSTGGNAIFRVTFPSIQYIALDGASPYLVAAGPAPLGSFTDAPRQLPGDTVAHGGGIVEFCVDDTPADCVFALALGATSTPDVVPFPSTGLTTCSTDTDCTNAGAGDTCEPGFTGVLNETDGGIVLTESDVCGWASVPFRVPTPFTISP